MAAQLDNGWEEVVARQALLAQWTLDQRKTMGTNTTIASELLANIKVLASLHPYFSFFAIFVLSLSLSLFLSLSSFFFSFQNVSLLFPLISSFLAANSPLFGSKMKQPKLLPQKVFSLYSLLLSFSSTLSNSSLRAYLSFAIVYPVSWFLFCCFILLAFCVFISSFLSSSVM